MFSQQTPHQKSLDSLEDRYPISQLADRLDSMWYQGWHPLDIARQLGTSEPVALSLFTDLLTLNRSHWHSRAAALWSVQAEALGATSAWWDQKLPYWPQFLERHGTTAFAAEAGVALISRLLDTRVTLPLFEPPPNEAGSGGGRPAPDDGVLAKVRALLAKAESTTFDEEAEALSAKAQELIARHSIDVALLAIDIDVPGGKRIYIDPPYTKAKFVLLDNVANANGCRSCWNDCRATATVIGHQTELHLAEMLFTSLLLQATAVVVAARPAPDRWGRSTTRSWRNAFWYGYAFRIGERLAEAAQAGRAQHVAHEGADLLPVLVSRSEAVEQAFDEAFPDLSNLSTSISNAAGLTAGHNFGDRADLVAQNAVPDNLRHALES